MNEKIANSICRCCKSQNIKKFRFNHFTFLPKPNDWDSFYCFECGSVSDFNIKYTKDIYSSGAYRNIDIAGVKSPIDFFSEISFLRWKHIFDSLKIYLNKERKLFYLDYGGYNGFLQFALKQKLNLECTLADYDQKGLEIAKIIGLETIDLNKIKFSEYEKNFDLISLVHVIEHLEDPKNEIKNLIRSLNLDGLIYAEIPNLYGFPMSDKTHLTNFSKFGFLQMFKDLDLNILEIGYCSTPNESIKHNYYLNSKKENIYIIAKKTKEKKNYINLKKDIYVFKSIPEFKRNLFLSYSKIMIKDVPFNLIKNAFKKIKTATLFYIYGLLELISIKIFKFSIINKFFNKK